MSISDLAPDVPERVSEEETRRALLQGLGTGVMVLCCVALTYVVPDLEDYRPWIDGEAVPFAHWMGGQRASGSEAPTHLANGLVTLDSNTEGAEAAGIDTSLLAAAVVEDTADEAELLAPPPVGASLSPTAPSAVLNSTRTPDGAEKSVDISGGSTADMGAAASDISMVSAAVAPEPSKPPKHPALHITASDYENVPMDFELTNGTLDHFYQQLARTGRREAGAVVRVSHYGDSVIGADGLTSSIRRKLQARFGSAGKGWVNVAPGWQWYRQKDVIYKARGWKSKTVTSNKLSKSRWAPGRYGYGGVAGIGWGAKSTYEAYADRLELYYLAFPRGGRISVRIDGGDWSEFETREDLPVDRYRVFSASGPGKHTFEVRASGGGNVHTYGVTLETGGPGIVYDAVQMVGTRSSRLLNFNSEHIKAQVEHRAPDLQVFMYGGNEVGDSGSLETYAEKYTEAIRRMRAGRPEASCLVMTPVAHGEKYRGRIRTNRRMLEMVPVQRSIAESVGCAFYNTFEAMGGDGASGRWYKSGLMSGDFAHMTSKGNKVLGAMFYQALLKDFTHWLHDHPDA